jgi:ubiquinone/menaquinone biosynthesis methyltransferase
MPDNDYDAATIAFGIRNVTHIDTALQEIYRVLKPGGMFLCLEFSPVGQGDEASKADPFAKVYNLYSDMLIPRMGQMVTGDAQPYEYLVQSIRKFPPPEIFAEKMRTAGFARVTLRPMTHGVVSLHKGWKV